MNLMQVSKEFPTEEECLKRLEQMRWPKGVECLSCHSPRIVRIERRSTTKNKRKQLYKCLACREQFSATSGTLFHDSHLPLRTWFMAIALMCNGKKGISAKQMERD